ncbi:MAG: SEC59/DGK1/VTE5 family protein [Candidatus Aenigmatarchaeota archaeon]
MKNEFARQLVHLSGIFFVMLAQFIGRNASILCFFIISLFFFVYSFYVRRVEKAMDSLFKRFENKFRNFTLSLERKENIPYTGAFFFYAGFTLTFILFPLPIASAACSMLAVGDALSTLVGLKFGKIKIGNKTFEGSVACFLGSLLAGVFFVNFYISLVGATMACVSEFIPKINDNLAIPILSGFAMFFISFII